MPIGIEPTVCGAECHVAPQLAGLRDDVVELKEQVTQIHHLLVGNGGPGYGERIRNLEREDSTLREEVNGVNTVLSQVRVATFSAVGALFVGLFVMLAKWALGGA